MVNLNSLKVAELKEQCVARGLDAKGLKKAELVALLQSDIDRQAAVASAPAPEADPVPVAPVDADAPMTETPTEEATNGDTSAEAVVEPAVNNDVEEKPAAEEVAVAPPHAQATTDTTDAAISEAVDTTATTNVDDTKVAEAAEADTTESEVKEAEGVAAEGTDPAGDGAADAKAEDGQSAEANETIPKKVRIVAL